MLFVLQESDNSGGNGYAIAEAQGILLIFGIFLVVILSLVAYSTGQKTQTSNLRTIALLAGLFLAFVFYGGVATIKSNSKHAEWYPKETSISGVDPVNYTPNFIENIEIAQIVRARRGV